MPDSNTILSSIKRSLSHGTKQALTPAYYGLLDKLGNPHTKLPPVFHVAGTNGKGSTCAFLRAILEAAGYRVHVYTSPHLVRFHERIRLAGELITEDELVALLNRCVALDEHAEVSEFELATAAAFVAFAEHKADFTILEVGLGGRMDATNVVDKPLASLIARLSYDHREFLGDTIEKIAAEKAGIMKSGVPCFVSAQPDAKAVETLQAEAQRIGAPLHLGGKDWRARATEKGFSFDDATRHFNLPNPSLLGAHQYQNAGLAIAALSILPQALSQEIIVKGVQNAEWPARLQRLNTGVLAMGLKPDQQLWLDGGHNDSAGEVLAAQARKWVQEDGAKRRPLCLIYGMLSTKRPEEFLTPMLPSIDAVQTVVIPDEAKSFTAEELATHVAALGVKEAAAALSVPDALEKIVAQKPNARILICGSLYLAGHVLSENQK